jgi:hypothetical protein
MVKAKYQLVARMLCDGYSRRVIAQRLGMNVNGVNSCIAYARSIGVAARFDRERILLASAPPHIEKWLRAQVPDGATAGDVILAILNDAYSEDMENNRPTGQKEE